VRLFTLFCAGASSATHRFKQVGGTDTGFELAAILSGNLWHAALNASSHWIK
jgi:hypothetical protein